MMTLSERFAKFHAARPDVYAEFKRFAYDLLASGHTHGSAQQIIERVRWETAVNKDRRGGFKVNNLYRTMYARKLAAEDPRFAGFFRFRSGR